MQGIEPGKLRLAGETIDAETIVLAAGIVITTCSEVRRLRRTTQEALRRADEELVDARKRQREGVVEREVVLRAEVQRAETLQADHAATESEFAALAALNLAIGLKCNQPVRVLDPPEVPPMAITLAECLETAVKERREFGVVRSTVEIAVQGTRVAPGRVRSQSDRGWDVVRLPAAAQRRRGRFPPGVHPARMDAL